MRTPTPNVVRDDPGGSWKVYFTSRGIRTDVTFVRGAPTKVGNVGFTDPFGPSSATLTFPSITLLDELGEGDLSWCVRHALVDIEWVTTEGETLMVWEGMALSRDWSEDDIGGNLAISAQGLLRVLDNYLAKPEYVWRPLPYEYAILKALRRPNTRLATPRLEWPEWWSTVFDRAKFGKDQPWAMPQGVTQGSKWSGLVTRSTGNFDQVLTGYVQTILSAWGTDRGRFTVDLDRNRVPVIRHRDFKTDPDTADAFIDLIVPGVNLTLSEDDSQRVTDVYGQGTSLNGQVFTGQKVTSDGTRTFYEPWAARKETWPAGPTNPWWDPDVLPKEVAINFPPGVSELDAAYIAKRQVERFSVAGLTGQLSLKVNPVDALGRTVYRQTLRAGMSITIKGIYGRPSGVIFHITESNVDEMGNLNATLDSRFRDALTVQEVRARGRDSLNITRAIQVGQYNPVVPDQLYPWSYAEGSGFMPLGSQKLFTEFPNAVFPYTAVTRARPPKDPKWRKYYARVGPMTGNADDNWANAGTDSATGFKPYAIRLAARGDIRLLCVAAYDEDGNVAPVGFHVSLYYVTPQVSSMPVISATSTNRGGYLVGQHYPFFDQAWESVREDGGVPTNTQLVTAAAELIVGFGTGYEKAGYYPSSSAVSGSKPTGLLVNETGWGFDFTTRAGNNATPSQNTAAQNRTREAALAYVMIYCDERPDNLKATPIYFLARAFRREPGVT